MKAVEKIIELIDGLNISLEDKTKLSIYLGKALKKAELVEE